MATADEAGGRWLLLGEPAAEPLDIGDRAGEQGMDEALGALYDEQGSLRARQTLRGTRDLRALGRALAR